jgi:hypothetical protein
VQHYDEQGHQIFESVYAVVPRSFVTNYTMQALTVHVLVSK